MHLSGAQISSAATAERLRAGDRTVQCRPKDQRSRPQHWNDAAKELISLQNHCRQWLDVLPPSLYGTSAHEKLAAIDALDLEAPVEIDFPCGYGRD